MPLVVLLGVACSDDDPPADGDTADSAVTEPDGAGDSGEDTAAAETIEDTGETEDTGPEVPILSEAGLCSIPDQPRLSVSAGEDLHRVTIEDPMALCNDGSPAIYYIRPAPAESPDADKWVVWLEGGGGCRDATSCGDRWCGRHPVYSAAKMSSRFAPESVEGRGIFDPGPADGSIVNRFAGFNLVMAYYCSSDTWSGSKEHVFAADENYPAYRLIFHGSHVVTALIESLKTAPTSDNGLAEMRSIDQASLVVFAGTSGGGGGVRRNADRVAELLASTNPDVTVRVVVDAGVHPTDPPLVDEEVLEAALEQFWTESLDIQAAVLDRSCLEFHADDPRICALNTHALIHHVTTPWYVKMDLTDSANAPGLFADTESFGHGVHALLLSLADLSSWSEEAMDFAPGVFGPRCSHHVNLETGDFYRIRLDDGSRQPVSNHDVLWNWLNDTGETTFIVHDPDNGVTSHCP